MTPRTSVHVCWSALCIAIAGCHILITYSLVNIFIVLQLCNHVHVITEATSKKKKKNFKNLGINIDCSIFAQLEKNPQDFRMHTSGLVF